MYRTVQRLTPEQVEVVARQLYIEMLKGGYTRGRIPLPASRRRR